MTKTIFQRRRLLALAIMLITTTIALSQSSSEQWQKYIQDWREFLGYDLGLAKTETNQNTVALLESLEVKGRAPKTGYSREQFSDGWARIDGCDMRNRILQRDLVDVKIDQKCNVVSGKLNDQYTGKTINFERGQATSSAVQIDHIVAVSDAWQKGAQQLTYEQRHAFYNDPDNLIASDGPANQQKGDSDAASWLPPNKSFRCQYVTRQIIIKARYQLWVTAAEKEAMVRELNKCV
ncbi:MAG: HNH endonuclease family protein [Candidatus Saccharibacteria bacterium]|nr:HNH endonuclease family protein [Candidatus Saccharibacteria bacterium]